MALSMYDISVPVFRQFLGALQDVLNKAEAHCSENKIDPATYIDARLAEDMQPLSFQVLQTIGHSAGALAQLSGKQQASTPSADSFSAMKKSIAQALDFLESLKPEDLDGAESRAVELNFPGRQIKFKGLDYLQSFAMPNFFFHATTAYDILRNRGVGIGKRDFMGAVRFVA